jgi:hypothetical protein
MPGKAKAGGRGQGHGQGQGGEHGQGHGGGVDRDERGDSGGTDYGRPDSPGRSEWSPGHLKKDAGADSASDYAPGHGGEAPGQRGRDDRSDQDEGETLT